MDTLQRPHTHKHTQNRAYTVCKSEFEIKEIETEKMRERKRGGKREGKRKKGT